MWDSSFNGVYFSIAQFPNASIILKYKFVIIFIKLTYGKTYFRKYINSNHISDFNLCFKLHCLIGHDIAVS